VPDFLPREDVGGFLLLEISGGVVNPLDVFADAGVPVAPMSRADGK
jgi:hypothetical protein